MLFLPGVFMSNLIRGERQGALLASRLINVLTLVKAADKLSHDQNSWEVQFMARRSAERSGKNGNFAAGYKGLQPITLNYPIRRLNAIQI